MNRSVPECFAARARPHLDTLALATDRTTMSYRQIGRLADQLAHRVWMQLGGRAAPVGLMLDHDAAVPAALLGVLRTGSFYVPLDPTYPAERNRYVLADCGAEVVVTNDANRASAEALGIPSRQLLNLDEVALSDVGEFAGPPVAADDLVYVLYTSGSTGRPKGVMRTHRGLLRNVMHQTHTRGVREGDRIGLLFSYSFGASMANVFTALLNGATLCPFNVGAAGVHRLADWLSERRITSFHTVPTIFRQLTAVLGAHHEFPALRHIQLGGETMFADDLARFKKHFGAHSCLIVGMGTSESGHVFEFVADKDTECSTEVLPVGYPVEDAEIHLVDADGTGVGVNRVGEIAVSGAFVSPGYWGQPDLTARKIQPRPNGTRTLLTGDLGYMLADGCVFLAGRTDERLRINGQSIEIPEIEAALRHVEGVSQAAVICVGDPPAIVACVASDSGIAPAEADLRRAARERLPEFMVPSRFVVLETMPLLPNGKVDRQRLIDAAHARRRAPRVERSTAEEETLAGLYREVLGVPHVGVDDNFFEIGGHSLPAMRLLARVETVFGKRLTPDVLLTAPTVRQLAAVLSDGRPSADLSSLVALQPAGSKPPFFWIHGQKSNVFLPRLLGPDQPLYGLVQQGIDGRPALHRTVEDIAAYYLRAMKSVQQSGPYFLGGFCVGAVVAFEIAQQLRHEGHDVALLAMLDPPYRSALGRWSAMRPADRPRRLVPEPAGLAEFASNLPRRVALRARQQIVLAREAARRIADAVRGVEHRVLPDDRPQYINAIYSRARRRYRPAAYPGRLAVLRTEGNLLDPRRIWERLAGAGADVHEVPGPHEEVVYDPARIETLAETLRGCLREAQARGRHQ
jgi:amino acid adenylation domain-containing protein